MRSVSRRLYVGMQSAGLRLLIIVAAALPLAACANRSYMGIALTPGRAAPDLQNLALRARSGDKQAQFDLGMRFEEGKGVIVNRSRAIRLYRQSATDTGPLWVYSPGYGATSKGMVVSLDYQKKKDCLKSSLERLKIFKDADHEKN